MTDIATHVRIFDPKPSDDLVEKWTAAVNDLAEEYFAKLRTTDAILSAANDAASAALDGALMPTSLADKVEEALQKHSPSFVRAERDLEMLVCLLLALLQYVKSAKQTSANIQKTDIMAAGLWSALSFQPQRSEARLETLRASLISACESAIADGAEALRSRSKVPDFSTAIGESVEVAALAKAIKPGTGPTIAALRSNAILDREELDLLWWALGDWSDLLDERLSAIPAEVAAVVSGIEVGRRLRKLPALAHKHLALRNVLSDVTLTLPELLDVMSDRRGRIAQALAQLDQPSRFQNVFPLTFALISGKPAPNRPLGRSVRDWAARALLEASVLHVLFEEAGA